MKLVTCTIASVFATTMVLCVGVPKATPRQSGGREYWVAVLRGKGVEIGRKGNRIDFMRRRLGGQWRRCYVSAQEAEAARSAAVAGFVREWLSWGDRRGGRKLDHWDSRLLAALTGLDADMKGKGARDWWFDHEESFAPTAAQVEAFLRERESQFERWYGVTQEAWKGEHDEVTLALYSNRYLERLGSHWFTPDYLADLKKGRVGVPVWRNVIFESVYYPVLIFYLAYAVPWCWRRLRDWDFSFVSCWIVVGCQAWWGVVMPHTLGYSPYWCSSAHRKDTVFYNRVLLPPGLIVALPVQALAGTGDAVTLGVSRLVDRVIPPVLWWFNSYHPPEWPDPLPETRGLLLLWGTLVYGGVGAIIGVMARERTWRLQKKQDKVKSLMDSWHETHPIEHGDAGTGPDRNTTAEQNEENGR